MSLSPTSSPAIESGTQVTLGPAASPSLPARVGGFAPLIRAIGAAIARAGTLVPDSRDRLPSKEQDLAKWGVVWNSDPALDRELARELHADRQRRQAGLGAPVLAAQAKTRVEARRPDLYGLRRLLRVALAR